MTCAPRRGGHALVGTMIFLVLVMMLWAAAYQQTASHVRAEKTLRVRAEKADSVKRAMAWCLSLLETGRPNVGLGQEYRCLMAVDGDEYVAIFTRTDTSKYDIRIRPKVYWYDDWWPVAPESF